MVANHSGTTLETENRNSNSTEMEPNSYDSALNTNPNSKLNGQQKQQKDTLNREQKPQQYIKLEQPQKMAPTDMNEHNSAKKKHFHTYRYVNTIVGRTLKPYETMREKELWEKGRKDTGKHPRCDLPEIIDLTNEDDDEETVSDTEDDDMWKDEEQRATREVPEHKNAGTTTGHLAAKTNEKWVSGGVVTDPGLLEKVFPNGNRIDTDNGYFNGSQQNGKLEDKKGIEISCKDDEAYDVTHQSFVGSIWYRPKPTPIYAYALLNQ
jgi:hypothetical protein